MKKAPIYVQEAIKSQLLNVAVGEDIFSSLRYELDELERKWNDYDGPVEDHEKIIQYCLDCEGGYNEFLESLLKQCQNGRSLSIKQREALYRIHLKWILISKVQRGVMQENAAKRIAKYAGSTIEFVEHEGQVIRIQTLKDGTSKVRPATAWEIKQLETKK